MWNRGFNPQSDYCKEYPTYCRAKFDYLFDSPYEFSNHCCNIMKKKPSKEYEKETGRKPIIGTMASESRIRTTTWLKDGCNSFDVARPTSKPISFWTEQDVLLYIKMNNLPICSVYGEIVEIDQIQGQMSVFDYEGVANKELFESNTPTLKTTGRERTGCMFCGYGCTTKNWNNLVEMKETHPKTYEWIMKPWEEGGLNYKEIIDWLNKHGNLNIRY